ncbi:MAG TPA: dihydrolipoyl dehydrogenase [Acidimicrobiales bacterium]|jgi:dihydrolipoamide dehydrogenase|nr:dihydrolipoyl dehydrogenase [Acidimicrobiales bacterium]
MGEHRSEEFDVVVLGGGTGGYSAALRASGLGLRAALVERDLVGGTCLHRGCIPSKALLHAASVREAIEDGARRWGIASQVTRVDAKALGATRDDIVERNYRGLLGHLAQEKVALFAGTGRVTSPRTVEVTPVPGGELTAPVELRARRGLVVATGSRPRQLPGAPADGTLVVTSDEATRSEHLPASVLIVGAGAIGVEFATFYRAFGAEVTLVEVLERVLPTEDPDVSREMQRALRRKGVAVLVKARVEEVEAVGGEVRAVVRGEDGARTIVAERLLSAIGRAPVTEGLGLEEIGVRLERGYVLPASWERLETHVPGVHVVGDVLPPPSLALAHASFAEGLLVAEVLAGRDPSPISYANVPRATYSLPEAASVGLTEPEARERGMDVVTNRLPLGAIAKGLIYGEGGMVKLVAERGGPVVGVHLVGPHVTELIAEGMLITSWEALPLDVADLIHPHPSLSEAVGEAHLTLAGRRLHQLPA